KAGLFAGDEPLAVDHTFTLFQATLFFSIYVFFQVWNQVNCRSLSPRVSGLRGILANPTFLVIGGAVAIGQILIVTFGGRLFQVEPLGIWAWLGVIAFTSTVLAFAEIMRFARRRDSFNPEQTATAGRNTTVAVGSGLNNGSAFL